MKNRILSFAFLLATAVSTPAWAATVTGRITYLDLSAHQLMLDNSEMYTVASDISPEGLEVGRLITADVVSRGKEKMIAKLLKYT